MSTRKSKSKQSNLVAETAREHFVGLIQHKDGHLGKVQNASVDHIKYTTRRADDDLYPSASESNKTPKGKMKNIQAKKRETANSLLKALHIGAHRRSANTGVRNYTHKIT
jgi:hypothetical protein